MSATMRDSSSSCASTAPSNSSPSSHPSSAKALYRLKRSRYAPGLSNGGQYGSQPLPRSKPSSTDLRLRASSMRRRMDASMVDGCDRSASTHQWSSLSPGKSSTCVAGSGTASMLDSRATTSVVGPRSGESRCPRNRSYRRRSDAPLSMEMCRAALSTVT